jgi:hypothetical protein
VWRRRGVVVDSQRFRDFGAFDANYRHRLVLVIVICGNWSNASPDGFGKENMRLAAKENSPASARSKKKPSRPVKAGGFFLNNVEN